MSSQPATHRYSRGTSPHVATGGQSCLQRRQRTKIGKRACSRSPDGMKHPRMHLNSRPCRRSVWLRLVRLRDGQKRRNPRKWPATAAAPNGERAPGVWPCGRSPSWKSVVICSVEHASGAWHDGQKECARQLRGPVGAWLQRSSRTTPPPWPGARRSRGPWDIYTGTKVASACARRTYVGHKTAPDRLPRSWLAWLPVPGLGAREAPWRQGQTSRNERRRGVAALPLHRESSKVR